MIRVFFLVAAACAALSRVVSFAQEATAKPFKVWGYCRASTKRQVESPDTQKEMINEYARFQRLPTPTVFVDPSTSGKVLWAERPAGGDMLKRVQPGDHVIITKLDRAFRKLSDCVLVLEQFERAKVKLHVVNLMGGALDLSSPMGRFLIHILAAFAELERAFISERTKDAHRNIRKKNQAPCRWPGYGFQWRRVWDKEKGKHVRIREANHEERAVMKAIASWRLQQPPWGWSQITDHLIKNDIKTKDGGFWSEMRVRRACLAEFKLTFKEQRGSET